MHPHDEESQLAAADRRARARRAGTSGAVVSVQAATLAADVENHSETGLFVIVDGPLTVTVTWEEGGEQRTDRAILRRLTSLPSQQAGWGLELIDDSEESESTSTGS